MRDHTRDWNTQAAGSRVCRGLWIGVAIAAFVLILGAAPRTQASDEFEHAFQYELGRAVAHEAVYAGHVVLGAVLPHLYHTPHHGYGYGDCGHYGHHVHHYKHRGHGHGHYRHHGHHSARHDGHHDRHFRPGDHRRGPRGHDRSRRHARADHGGRRR